MAAGFFILWFVGPVQVSTANHGGEASAAALSMFADAENDADEEDLHIEAAAREQEQAALAAEQRKVQLERDRLAKAQEQQIARDHELSERIAAEAAAREQQRAAAAEEEQRLRREAVQRAVAQQAARDKVVNTIFHKKKTKKKQQVAVAAALLTFADAENDDVEGEAKAEEKTHKKKQQVTPGGWEQCERVKCVHDGECELLWNKRTVGSKAAQRCCSDVLFQYMKDVHQVLKDIDPEHMLSSGTMLGAGMQCPQHPQPLRLPQTRRCCWDRADAMLSIVSARCDYLFS